MRDPIIEKHAAKTSTGAMLNIIRDEQAERAKLERDLDDAQAELEAVRRDLADTLDQRDELRLELAEAEAKAAELHHAPSVPMALVEAVCNAERFIGYLAQCKSSGLDVTEALEHAKATAAALRKSAGWS